MWKKKQQRLFDSKRVRSVHRFDEQFCSQWSGKYSLLDYHGQWKKKSTDH